MENVNCIICDGDRLRPLFRKAARDGELFSLVACPRCGLQFLTPRPAPDEIASYYDDVYFMKRTERGYDNYFSEATRREIERVMEINLRDLGFFDLEKRLPGERRVLDIGCAAGYFLSYLTKRGWKATGVDISASCVEFARGAGLTVYEDDYLDITFSNRFDIITLWASLEHLHQPGRFLAKAREELSDGGSIYISTCRTGGLFMKISGPNWRFYNFPEHLYFFSRDAMQKILEQNGLRIVRYATYGSGFGKAGSLARRLADAAAKNFQMGDMMLIAAEKAGIDIQETGR